MRCTRQTLAARAPPSRPMAVSESGRSSAPSAKCSSCALRQPPNTSSMVNTSPSETASRTSATTAVVARTKCAWRRSPVPRRRQVLQVGLGLLARAASGRPPCRPPSPAARPGSLHRGNTISKSVAELLDRECYLVFPGDQHVADVALDEGGGGAARAAVEHGTLLKSAARIPRLRGRAAALDALAPGGQVVAAAAAGGLRIGGDRPRRPASPGRPNP